MKNIIYLLLFTIFWVEIYAKESVYKSAPIGTYGGRMNPDLSVVVDIQGLFTDDIEYAAERNKVLLPGVEIVFGGYLYPGIRGDIVTIFEDGGAEFHLEEAYISFLELPIGTQLITGRKLLDFGRLNQSHPHHWKFVDMPLALENVFGHHPWYGDLVNLNFLIPNPVDIYAKGSFSVINAMQMQADAIQWNGRVFNSRVSVDLPWLNSIVGYSRAFDEMGYSTVQGIELTYKEQWPGFIKRRLRLQNEYVWAKSGDVKRAPGLYSMLAFALDQYTELGLRCDGLFSANNHKIKTWAGNLFATYYFTDSLYLRGQYQYKQENEKTKNKFYLQLVWGIGPHAHKLED